MNASSKSLTGGVTIADRFQLVRPLSSGGMGSVWIATHTTLGTEVAIKFVDIRGESRDALARFEREANVVARLRSPHVVQILDYGVDEAGRPYLAMELLNGESLKKRLERTNVLSLSEVASIVVQICRALQRAHKAGVVHRDIKPANIFLTEEDDALHVKVLDFGVAKSANVKPGDSDSQKTETGTIVGTPAYMSPEQVLGSDEIDGRSDLFSLGVLAWRLLVGSNPHERDGKPLGFGELLIQIATKPVPPPSQFVAGIPPEVDAWFARALSIDTASRFASAKEMANAIARATHMPLLSGTGAFTMPSLADISGPHLVDDSDDARIPIEVAELRERGQFEAASGERPVAHLDSGLSITGVKPRRRALPWIVAGAALLLVVAFFALRRPSEDPPVTASGPPSASASPASPPEPVAAPLPTAADPAPALSTSSAAAPGSGASAPSTNVAPQGGAAQPRVPPRAAPPPPPAPPPPAPPKPEPPKKPTSPNTLLDDRL